MQFHYQAVTGAGQSRSGVAPAASLAELRRRLREEGLILVSAAETSAADGRRTSGAFFAKSISRGDVLNLTSQLAIMSQAGVDLASALDMLAAECEHPTLKKVLRSVHERVTAGERIHEALRKHPEVFDEAYAASVAAGEAAGKLHVVLARLAEMLSADIRLRSTLRGMLAYPVVLMVVSLGVLVSLVFFVLPTFAEVFQNMGVPLPALTAAMLEVSQALRANVVVVAGGVAAATGLFVFWLRTPGGRFAWHRALLRIPVLRGVTRYIAVGRAFRLLGTMVESGVPLMEGLGLCQNAVKNLVYRELFREIRQDVLSGKGMAQAIERSPYVPPAAASMVATGERTGNLGRVLELLGNHYESQAETRFRDVSTILEPAMVVFVGGLVATVVLSLVLPMFDFTAVGNSQGGP